MYTVLVGPPGIGKSQLLSISENILRRVPNIFVAPSSVTAASLVDSMALAKRNVIATGFAEPVVEFYSLQVVASELGNFLPEYSNSFMNLLTKVYDGELYEERRRTGKVNHLLMEKPLLSMIGGTTPSYLNSLLPAGAWDQGFISRTQLIFSKEKAIGNIFIELDNYQQSFYDDLVADLKQISTVFGRMDFSDDCKAAMLDWNEAGLPPVPEHAKLEHYNSRRLAHTLKLCVVSALARSNTRFITATDFEIARNWLLEAEEAMPNIFHSMASSNDSRAIDDAYFFIKKLYDRDKKPVGQHMVYAYLRDRAASHQIGKIIEVMIQSQDIKVIPINGVCAFIPLPRQR
jgi:hypothetical protein